MNFQREKQHYDQHGFVVVDNLLSQSDFDQLRINLDRYICQVVPGLPSTEAFYEDQSRPETLKQLQRMGRDDFFRNIMFQPNWVALAEALVGEQVSVDEPEWFNKPPNTNHVTPPHQDNYYFCLEPSHVVTLWMAIDDVDPENGCLRYVDGSHRKGFRTHGKSRILGFSQGITDYTHEDFASEIAVPLRAGQAVAHHGMAIHRADANLSSTRHRRAFAMVFKGKSCRRDESAYARYLQASKNQQKELGVS
jgi:phytanoyl-CoA hydroxylase